MASITSTKAVDLKVNKINKANYDSMRTAGTITDTMAADEMWMGDGRLVSDSDLSAHTGDSGIHMTTAEKSKLSGIATGANNYIHPTTDGNKHVPATGTANDGKVLKAGATAGSLSWGTLTATDVGAYTKTEIDNKEFVYSDPAATFESFDPINAQFLGGNAPEYFAVKAQVDSAIEQKASFKSGSFTFPSGRITHKITNTFITASTLVTIIPTTEKKGSWTVNSTNGSFTIISDTVEPIDVICDWGAVK